MARRSVRNNDVFDKFEFVNVEFSAEEKSLINDWCEGRSLAVVSELAKIAEFGYKVSFSYDSSSELYSFTMTDKRTVKGRSKSPIYSIRHRDGEKIFAIGLWVFMEQLDAGAGTGLNQEAQYDW